MDRTQPFFRMRVGAADVVEWFDDVENAIWDVMKDTIGWGFLTGGAVVEHSPTPDLSVDVGQFLGYDQLGRRLYLASGDAPEVVNCAIDEVGATTAVTTPGNEKTLALFVEFDRKLSDPRLDGNGVTVQYQVDEWFKVNVVQSAEAAVGTSVPPPLRNDQILIADVVLIYNQTAILNADIDQSRKEDFVYDALTGAVIAEKLGFMGRAFQPANITAPAGTSKVVTTEMAGKTPGGDSTTRGVITGAPENYVKVFDDDRDNFLDANGNKVYGRITEAAGVWTLSFFTIVEGTPGAETAFDMTPFVGVTVLWYVQEVFSLDSFPVADPMFAVQSDQIAGEVPDATTTVKGKVELATDGEAAANVVVQGNDSRLLGLPALQLMRKMASRPSMVFMPNDTSPFTKYYLHQLHGLARGDYQAGSPWQPADFYFEIDPADADYPPEVFFTPWATPDAQPGRADNTKPLGAQDTWYYVYVIGRDSGTPRYALVFSDRAPWANGPLLDDSDFNFWNGGVVSGTQGRWQYWRFVAALVNGSSTAWELLVVRKMGNHVEYELAQRFTGPGDTAGAFNSVALAERVPPTSMRAYLRAVVTAASGGVTNSYELQLRPPAVGTMGLNEVPGVLRSQTYKLRAYAAEGTGAYVDNGSDTGWVALDTDRDVDAATSGDGASRSSFIEVLGYEEYDDVANAELSYG